VPSRRSTSSGRSGRRRRNRGRGGHANVQQRDQLSQQQLDSIPGSGPRFMMPPAPGPFISPPSYQINVIDDGGVFIGTGSTGSMPESGPWHWMPPPPNPYTPQPVYYIYNSGGQISFGTGSYPAQAMSAPSSRQASYPLHYPQQQSRAAFQPPQLSQFEWTQQQPQYPQPRGQQPQLRREPTPGTARNVSPSDNISTVDESPSQRPQVARCAHCNRVGHEAKDCPDTFRYSGNQIRDANELPEDPAVTMVQRANPELQPHVYRPSNKRKLANDSDATSAEAPESDKRPRIGETASVQMGPDSSNARDTARQPRAPLPWTFERIRQHNAQLKDGLEPSPRPDDTLSRASIIAQISLLNPFPFGVRRNLKAMAKLGRYDECIPEGHCANCGREKE
jgi:hypothetical protein